MCVILSGPADKIYPLMDKAMDANPHGNGLAWIDANKDGDIFVNWRKGIKDEDAKNIVKRLGDTNIVFHARIATVGGINGLLSHPFPVSLYPRLQYNGVDDMVLFHNGHFVGWEKFIPEDKVKSHEYSWSDSRAIAHALASGQITKEDLGEKVNGVFAVVSIKPFEGKENTGTIEHFGKWVSIEEGVWASNDNFLSKPNRWMYSSAYWNQDAMEYGSYYSRYYNRTLPKGSVYDRHSQRYI